MNAHLINYFLGLPRSAKRFFMITADSGMLVLGLWLAFSIRLGELYYPEGIIAGLFIVSPVLAVPIFIRFGLYRAIIRYIGFKAMWAIVQAVTLYALLWALLTVLSGSATQGLPRSVILLNWLVALMFVGGSRMIVRWWLNDITASFSKKHERTNVVIYGAGSAGMQIATVLSYNKECHPVAFIDDNEGLHKYHINSLRVYPFAQLGHLIKHKGVSEVLLALPSVSRSRRFEIIKMLEIYPVHVRTLPAMTDIAGGHIKVTDIKEIDVDDLLARDPVSPDEKLLGVNISNKVVMVTGAGGSIGSELCRQIIQQLPDKLILFEQNEYALYVLSKELKRVAPASNVISILGTVLNESRLELICGSYNVQTIYHAAAYKHVPIVENNPAEAIRNNIFGTLNVVQAAINKNVESFVLISTDKAVRPTSTMGASKRFAELILQSYGNLPDVPTCFSMVRFGNVLDSSGSVIPLFREQIHQGGPVTVTDPKIIRYFMTIHEAAELVIQAGAMGQGGDVFVLDMGEPVKILDLAKRMIHLSGLEVRDDDHPNGDISIEFTGLRPGEKLYEELLIGDNVSSTKHPLIMKAEEEYLSASDIMKFLDEFDDACNNNDQKKIRSILMEAIKDFSPQCEIDDHIYKEANGEKNVKEAIGGKNVNAHVLHDNESRV